jgi:hypothetical protein
MYNVVKDKSMASMTYDIQELFNISATRSELKEEISLTAKLQDFNTLK